jgi:hypothetical protein
MNMKTRMKILQSLGAVAVMCFVWLFCGPALASQEQNTQESNGFSAAQKLEGRWVRQSGGYVLVLQDIMPDGSLKAFYLNPRNINVHVASWKFEDERLFLYVEMRDVNYPGSNYTLMYRAATDVLWGSYYQAVQKQNMDVSFVRSK